MGGFVPYGQVPTRADSAEARFAAKFRRTVAGIPTRRFRDRLVAMATNRGLSVIAVDPTYWRRPESTGRPVRSP